MADRQTSRRTFLQLGGAGAASLFCTIGGETVDLSKPGAAARADAAAARVQRPQLARAFKQELPRPVPQPGGVYREYWIQARSVGWNIVPTGLDDWHNKKITGKTSFRAYVYQEMTAGFAEPKGGINMPGPTLYAEVGDVIVAHFRNADTKLRQAVTMHPHGVRYNPEYDGAYMGKYTRAGGFVAPGEELPTSGSASRTRSAPGPTTTTAPTTRSTRRAACSARSWSTSAAPRSPTSATR